MKVPSWGLRTVLLVAPFVVYTILGLALIDTRPGMQGDEAYLLEGAVRLLRGEEFVQWMATPYHASLKAYLLVPFFAVAGVTAEAARALNLVLGAVGIAGVGFFAGRAFGYGWSVIAMFFLAVHPGYVAASVFDSTGLPLMMAGLGLTLIALERFLREPGSRTAFVLGVALGFGTWTRANFIWINFALLAALLIVRFANLRHWTKLALPLIAGGVVGGLPLLIYQFQSRGGTFRYMREASSAAAGADFQQRLKILLDVFFYDAHRRYIWGGESIEPRLASFFIAACVALSIILTLAGVPRTRFLPERRLISVWVLLGLTIMLTTDMPLNQHHFLSYLPLFLLAGIGCFAAFFSPEMSRRSQATIAAAGCALAVGYFALVIYWIGFTVRALHANGGVDFWSDASRQLTAEVERRRAGRPVQVLDWGPNFTLYVESAGEIVPTSLFWNRSATYAQTGEAWSEVVRRGGLFVRISPDIAHNSMSADGFIAALRESPTQPVVVPIRQRNGRGYAEIYDLPPSTGSPLY